MKVTLFSKTTGEFGRVVGLPEHSIAANVPDGFGFKVGRFDRRSQRVDLETGAVIAYERPEAEIEAEQARRRIAELEAQRAQRTRQLLAESDPQLKAIEDEIAAKRADLIAQRSALSREESQQVPAEPAPRSP